MSLFSPFYPGAREPETETPAAATPGPAEFEALQVEVERLRMLLSAKQAAEPHLEEVSSHEPVRLARRRAE